MDKEVSELIEWLKAASVYELPPYKELPNVPLYMEQVTGYINDILKPLNPTQKDFLTSFMVNNYVKAGILAAPEKKKYTQDHLGYLLAMTTLKRTLSISEISLLIEMDKDVSTDKSVLYGFFRVMAKDILQESAQKTLNKTLSIKEHYDKEAAANNPDAENHLRDSLALIALRMSIQAGVYQALSMSILDSIGKDVRGVTAYQLENTPSHKEKEREMKINAAQSKRVAQTKKGLKK